MSVDEEALELHRTKEGKLSIESKVQVDNKEQLSLAYTPGVAVPCREISQNDELVDEYTVRRNLVAVVTNGSAVLGLGDIGPKAALPVMEGKAVLFKEFAGVDAFPLCLDAENTEDIVEAVKKLAPTFGGVNLEDISAPRCMEIESKLKEEIDIPVFHDDQHGTAIVVLAGLLNALRYIDKELENITVVVNGAGSAGIAITKLLLNVGVDDVILCDIFGILHSKQEELNTVQAEMAERTNKKNLTGSLTDAMEDADVFIGVSAPEIVTEDMVVSMAEDPIVFAMANPVPEIKPKLAKRAGARVVGTGRSDYDNQINNVLAFPGIFRGALDVGATDINEEMKIAAAYAIADLISDNELKADYVIPDPFDKRVVPEIAAAVAKAAIETEVARRKIEPKKVADKAKEIIEGIE
ncbi:NAD(P)-dependent malic enzyme [Sporohalobacter salinus]|uniref:NAD(P)-dependent malic enzyme n=1 Tax=Sporohalobacter salinus TaxID=1494606 RepID=UPI0019621DA4|nr:malic enzyme-like NAD(P)-binding protein [Sporohalobacter salinus]MBM7623321.1 malate dehydrogenase (oxaloacetate-decarboxylating) [Sporohalobacter salinus]